MLEDYIYSWLASFFHFECLEDGSVLEIASLGQYIVIEDNTHDRRWFLGYDLTRTD